MTMRRYVIGADGGGTKTDMVLVDHEGRLVGREMGGCSNYQAVGLEDLRSEISRTIEKLLEKTLVEKNAVTSVVLGLAGAGRKVDQDTILRGFESTEFSDRLFVESDAAIALTGAFANQPGIILIAGTGAICIGRDSDGKIHRAGGWGYLLGDEGSGYSIGRDALVAALKDFDGRGASTSLRKHFEDRFRLDSIDKIIPRIYKNEIDRIAVAALTPTVFKEAKAGDEVSEEIIRRAGCELGRLVKAVSKRMQSQESNRQVALIGSVFQQKDVLIPEMMRVLESVSLNVQFMDPEFDPAIGAVLLALEKSGVRVDDAFLQNLRHDIANLKK